MLEIYFESYGCTANQNSAEIMKGLVRQAGLNITSNIELADLIVINSCIVKGPTEEKIRRKVQDLLEKGKKVILAGCIPLNKKSLNRNNLFLLDTSQTKNIVSLIKDINSHNHLPESYTGKRNEVKLSLPKISNEKTIGITQISEGCFGECSYCIVKLAKGNLFSYPQEEIIKSIKNDLSSGCKEIWITSQDNASYGGDNGKLDLPSLLQEILAIKGNFFVRVGMMNPNNVLKILPELIECYKNKKMFKFLHLPIQSGSNKILGLMKRDYSIKDVMNIINEFKKQIPEITISTDIIVGFPGETQEDFQETVNLIEKINPEILNISKFWPRNKTPASKMNQLSSKIRTERATKLAKIHLNICKNNQEGYRNWEGKVFVDKIGFEKTYLARSENYKLFAVISKENILGKIINVKVRKIMPHYLVGEFCKTKL